MTPHLFNLRTEAYREVPELHTDSTSATLANACRSTCDRGCWQAAYLPFSSTTIFPALWSSTYSNSPMYPAIYEGFVELSNADAWDICTAMTAKCS